MDPVHGLPIFLTIKKINNDKLKLVNSSKELSYIKAPSVYLPRSQRLCTDNHCLHEVFIARTHVRGFGTHLSHDGRRFIFYRTML